jgi:hypothetical protein
VRESPHVGRFFGVAESLACPVSPQNLKFLPKVSGQYLENSRFAEPGGGDRFDLELRAGLGSPEDANFGRLILSALGCKADMTCCGANVCF